MEEHLRQLRRELDQHLSEYNHLSRKVREEEISLKESEVLIDNTLKAQDLVQQVAEAVQTVAHSQIASIVTHCLETVFGEDACQFQVKFSRKRGKTEAGLVFIQDGEEIAPLEASGGGEVDVAAFALRLVCLVLSLPKKRRLLVLDEPMKFVNGEEYQSRVGSLLKTLAKEMKVQIVIVTDDDWLHIGKVVELGSQNSRY